LTLRSFDEPNSFLARPSIWGFRITLQAARRPRQAFEEKAPSPFEYRSLVPARDLSSDPFAVNAAQGRPGPVCRRGGPG